jgi:hypothetical protein
VHLTVTLLSTSSSSPTPYSMSLMELLRYMCAAGGTTPSAPECIMSDMKFSVPFLDTLFRGCAVLGNLKTHGKQKKTCES